VRRSVFAHGTSLAGARPWDTESWGCTYDPYRVGVSRVRRENDNFRKSARYGSLV